MPIIASRNALRLVIRFFEGVGLAKLGDGFVRAPHDAQIVPVHVLGMRDGWTQTGVNLSVLYGLVCVSDSLVGMHEIMLRSRIVGRDCEGGLVVGDGSYASTLAATGGIRLLRIASQQPELAVVRILCEGLVDGLLVGFVFACVLNVIDSV